MEYRLFGKFSTFKNYLKEAIGILTIPYTIFVVNLGYNALYFPGGTKEDGESDIDTLRRELKEELGLKITKISKEFIETLVYSPKRKTNILVKTYIGKVEGDLIINSEEIESVLIFRFEEISEDLLLWLNQRYLLGPSAIDAFINKREKILKIVKSLY